MKEIASAIIIFGMGIVASYFLFNSIAKTQEQGYERQLNKCRGGNFCKVQTPDKTYRFLTLSGVER